MAAFKVMTWNVENLFRPKVGSGPTAQAAYDAKLAGLAATISAQAPDALALQEIGQPEALEDLVKLVGPWNTAISAHPDGRGIRVAWASAHLLGDPQNVADFPEHLLPVQTDDVGKTQAEMGRGAVAVTIEPGAGPL